MTEDFTFPIEVTLTADSPIVLTVYGYTWEYPIDWSQVDVIQ
ncbi:MAG: hypothetical protein ACTSWQ_00480 [Candidatus Thorarchaeota archaeon]